VLLAGCSAEAGTYEKRSAFLDKMSAEGIKYRGSLQKQDTEPSRKACEQGWHLLDPDIPTNEYSQSSSEWLAQLEEAYVKSCMTGETIPKPDPSGINARTAVPFPSVSSS